MTVGMAYLCLSQLPDCAIYRSLSGCHQEGELGKEFMGGHHISCGHGWECTVNLKRRRLIKESKLMLFTLVWETSTWRWCAPACWPPPGPQICISWWWLVVVTGRCVCVHVCVWGGCCFFTKPAADLSWSGPWCGYFRTLSGRWGGVHEPWPAGFEILCLPAEEVTGDLLHKDRIRGAVRVLT